MDDYLEIPLEEEKPLILFHCNVNKTNSDSLVFIGIENPDIYAGLNSVTLQFYLKNESRDLAIVEEGSENESSFLPFARIDGNTADQFHRDFPELKELNVFGLYLQGMKVTRKTLQRYKTLEDGTFRNITMRNAELINKREVLFISRDLDSTQSQYYKKLIDNTFSLKL